MNIRKIVRPIYAIAEIDQILNIEEISRVF